MKKIEVPIKGTVSTLVREGETEEQARQRIMESILNAEVNANATCKERFHLMVVEEPNDEETRCSHGVWKGDRCEKCVNEGVYTYAKPKEEYKCPHGKGLFERCDECVQKEVDAVASLPEGYGAEEE